MHFSVLLTLAAAATFTQPFPNFQGNRANLDRLVDMVGPLPLPQDATCLDEVFSNEVLSKLLKAVPSTGHNLLGYLLSDLSPQRFDALCHDNQDKTPYYEGFENKAALDALATGYSNWQSRWKRAYSMPKHTPVTRDNAHYHLAQSDELCELMADRPADSPAAVLAHITEPANQRWPLADLMAAGVLAFTVLAVLWFNRALLALPGIRQKLLNNRRARCGLRR